MSWLVYMPLAAVTGEMKVDGTAYDVAGKGYHDHNWGEWVFTNARWNWAQYAEEGFAIEIGDFIGKPAGIVGIDVDGSQVVFEKEEYSLVHTRWQTNAAGRLYPVESLLYAENRTTRVWLKITVEETEPLIGDAPSPLPDPIIYEQTALYEGKVWKKDWLGRWRLVKEPAGRGFKEYTANAWR
jgi:hypothetical protein